MVSVVHAVRDHGDGDGQIEARALLLQIRRREIDRRAAARIDGITAVGHRGPDPVPALSHRRIRQAHDDRHRLHQFASRRLVDFDLDLEGIHAMQGGGKDTR